MNSQFHLLREEDGYKNFTPKISKNKSIIKDILIPRFMLSLSEFKKIELEKVEKESENHKTDLEETSDV